MPGSNADHERGQGASFDLEAGRRLFSAPCTFVTAVPDVSQLPLCSLPEIAFAGRSNVGKSSLINALTNRRTLARTSNQSGCTQHVLFFQLANRLILVDLPGYGYAAKAPKAIVQQWTGLVYDYLCSRPSLRRVLLLIDGRHGIKNNDHAIMCMLDRSAVSYQLILTKADKMGPGEIPPQQVATSAEAARHAAAYPYALITSAAKHIGIPILRATLEGLSLPGRERDT
ncbi:GTP-binding protein EngB [invertebrate metagenome]|uniref:GTP-binding protein EngB n=1 Tax=invertebrate metagenome TaxID=1711999 RepID=A0A484HCL7_9ZZZZ